jgi:aspartate/methionine/tyrosine aminotransferase
MLSVIRSQIMVKYLCICTSVPDTKMYSRLSQRFSYFDSSDFRNIFLRRQYMVNPIDLSVGIPEDHTPDHIKMAGVRAIENNYTRYTPANGLPELRELLAKKAYNQNDISVTPDDITVVPGLTTGLLLVYMALLDPGDEIIIMDPCYPPYNHLASAIGATVMPVLTLPTFHPDIDAIEASITNKTKAIVINTPNNPTGAIYNKLDLLRIADIANRHNLFVISDEIYEHFVYEKDHFSIGSIYPNTITMNGFSKEYAMTGWRLGYISGPTDVINAINELQQYVVFSSSTIAQYAAIEAIKHPSNFKTKYHAKRNTTVAKLKDLGYKVHGAEGAYYVFFQAPNDLTDLEFIERAAEQELLLVPGRAFSSRHGYVRLSYGVDHHTLEEGLRRLALITNVIK